MTDHLTPPLRARIDGELVFVEKLAGFNTHAPDAGKPGLAELLERSLGRKVYVVHRLDKETSGAMIFALSGETAARVAELFEKRAIEKRYLFVTDRKSSSKELTARSLIEKKGAHFSSDPDSSAPNAFTTFRHLRALPFGELWEARPATGKPHQIRLHAQDLGLAILGDDEHGGSAFPRLCLHSKQLSFSWDGREIKHEAVDPAWTTGEDSAELGLLRDAMDSRARLFDLAGRDEECLRLVHREVDFCRVDQYGSQLWVNWYRDHEPTADELAFFERTARARGQAIVLRKMQNRGADPTDPGLVRFGEVHDRWEATENGLRFELRTESGQSAGLFLDQRENRRWVREHATGRRVLNLFSYTAGFSVAAAAGGASQVCTVDVSAKFNEWGQRNFAVNGLDPKAPGREFWAQDCLLFLKGAVKRGRRWDLIVCDPPSFGRSKEGTFQIQKHLPRLLENLLPSLERGGRLLLSCNYEEWTTEDLRDQVLAFRKTFPLRVEPAPLAGLDFERPGEEPLMKSVLVTRN